MAVPTIPENELEFALKKEEWSQYELLNGELRVWVRAITTKIFEIPPPPGAPPNAPPAQATASETLVAAFWDKKHKGSPVRTPWNPTDLATGGTPVEFDVIREPWNEYVVAGKKPRLLKTKVVATGFRVHHDKRNQFGEPIVLVDSNVVVSPATDLPGHVSA